MRLYRRSLVAFVGDVTQTVAALGLGYMAGEIALNRHRWRHRLRTARVAHNAQVWMQLYDTDYDAWLVMDEDEYDPDDYM